MKNIELPKWTSRSRNLVRFCRHLPHEQLAECFPAAFGFRSDHSRFSVLKNYGTLPGPDDCFSHLQLDARPVFEKLLGLEIEYPGAKCQLQSYSSMNYYRSHIEEVFHHTAPQHHTAPPTRGRCLIYFDRTDVLRVEFHLENVSETEVHARLRWFSIPTTGDDLRLTPMPGGFSLMKSQNVERPCKLSATLTGADFSEKDGQLTTERLDVMLSPQSQCSWTFEVRFDDEQDASPAPPKVNESTGLVEAVARVETLYAALPKLPTELQCFEPLALKAAGVMLTSRFLERDRQGKRVAAIHGGKTGVGATWFWDTATSLLGLGLLSDAKTGWGSIQLLCNGIAPDGEPSVRYANGHYMKGVQNPILAWGTWNFFTLCPDLEELERNFPAFERYVKWWIQNCTDRESGLCIWPSSMGCTGLDDALQWAEHFPIRLRKGETWHEKDWGHSRPDQFVSVDINCHLYLECRALANMARALGKSAEMEQWNRTADNWATRIQSHLFNSEAGIYQARSIVDGRFNEIISLESFLPIYAGITPRPLAQDLCREFLLSPDHFYTLLPFPTLPLSHHAFRSSGSLYEPPEYPGAMVQQAYWTGRTWLNYNYWMVGALEQAGLSAEADAAVVRICDAVSRSESISECYDPLTGTGTGHTEFPWGSASTLAMLYRFYRKGPLAPNPLDTPAISRDILTDSKPSR